MSTAQTKEIRSIETELRAVDGKTGVLRGYAAVFDKPSLDLGGFIEVVRKGAFARSLASLGDILAFGYHDPSRPLARRSASTLSLSEDDAGLLVEIRLANTQLARDLVADIEHGNVKGMSFGFSTRKDLWTAGGGGKPDLRELIDVDLFEVSAVSMPAYPDTSLALRSKPQAEATPRPDLGAVARANALYLRLFTLQP